MGTNYYRIPTEIDLENKKNILLERIKNLELNSNNISKEFRFIEIPKSLSFLNPWDEFIDKLKIHLGKKSMGWKFLWNFHDKKLYNDKESLFKFIRSGRVIDEYGDIIDNDEFIDIALNWDKDGLDSQTYRKKHPKQYYYDFEKQDIYIDDLRIAPYTDFS